MLGLDAAGKTSASSPSVLERTCLVLNPVHSSFLSTPAILYKLKLDQSVTTIPTGVWRLLLGVSVSSLEY